jgi:ABC-type branched-subunit amino acid transport system ATPase component
MTNAGLPLDVAAVSVRFGGLAALVDVSLQVPERSIVGLIGPNGAGKTTLFNAVTGVVRPARGQVRLFGTQVTNWPVHKRARLGLARTFQRLELFSSMSVRDNLVVAHEAYHARGGLFSDLLALPPTLASREAALARADEVLAFIGLEDFAHSLAGEVPAGVARLVEVARALCTGPKLLLLDEPSAGLRRGESARLAAALRSIRDEQGVSILVVEHDMEFVLGLCEDVYVLDFGQLLAHGSPDEIRRNPAVQAAYLGEESTDAVAAGR